MYENALVLSGGGSRGAFEVGVIKKLTEWGRSWDIIVGVSAGALNGAFLAQYPRDQQRQGALDLEQFWLQNVKGNKSIYKPWLFGYLSGLWRGGLYNTKPLRQLVAKNLSNEKIWNSNVALFVGVVNAETGQWDLKGTGLVQDMIPWVLASSAFPVAFPPIRVNGQHWIDGGARNVTPLKSALQYAKSGDVVIAQPIGKEMDSFPSRKANNVLDVAIRTMDILVSEVAWDDLQTCAKNNGYVVHAPDQNVINDPLTFDPDQIQKAIQAGYDSVKFKIWTA